jgi:hypothetical protein
MQRYNCSLRDVLYGTINTVRKSFFFNPVDESMRGSANLLQELLMIRDGLVNYRAECFLALN